LVVDHLAIGDVRITLNRVPAGRWTAAGELRSWARARLLVTGDEVLVPCPADEALWLGAWCVQPPAPEDAVSLEEGPRQARLALREGTQLRGLAPDDPLCLPPSGAQRSLRLSISGPSATPGAAPRAPVARTLRLLRPDPWARQAGEAVEALGEEPPLPPRLG
jgi:hypothetical protein